MFIPGHANQLLLKSVHFDRHSAKVKLARFLLRHDVEFRVGYAYFCVSVTTKNMFRIHILSAHHAVVVDAWPL